MFVLTNSTKCVSLKNQDYKVREVITDNKYMAFPYNNKVNRFNGSCNKSTNLYARVCAPDIVENITVKMFDLMTLTNTAKQIEWHESCNCVCKLNSTVCNNKQKWNENKCRCECLVNKKCDNDFIWNISNCEFEYRKKAVKLTTEEECEEINDSTIVIKELVENCKPFVASSILFLLVTTILTELLIYFYIKSRPNNALPY